ncbi:MAG: DEAD/DEAH box helicase [Kofleriaceae bacterium]
MHDAVPEEPPGSDAVAALRPYQRSAVEGVLAAFRAGHRSTLLVLATGTGKTVVFAEVARRGVERGRRVLVLAHRTELITQAAEKLANAGVEAQVDQGERRASEAPCVVASVQTLRGPRLERWARDAFDLVVVDEAHHATAASYRAVLERFTSAKVLGVTATPDRLDGHGMGEVFESVAYRYELRQAIRDGWLAPIRARRVAVDGVDLATVHTRAGDLDRSELAAIMAHEEALHGVAVPLLELAGSRPTILFGVDVAHAKALAGVLNRYVPGAAMAVDGGASAAERADVLASFRSGEFRFLVNCALLVEGYDEPSIACVAVARPTKSRALYAQMVGRGTRLAPGKEDCLVLDFTGQAGRHRLVGPADVLAPGGIDDDVRERIEAALDVDALELDELLATARSEVAEDRHRAKVLAVARYRAEEVDPFLGGLPDAPRTAWAVDSASSRQRDALAQAGFVDLPPELTKGEACRWLDAIAARRSAGLATVKQVRLLRRYGIDAVSMTLAEACGEIRDIETTHWRKRAGRAA